MSKIKKFSVLSTVGALTLLAACGGGGGGTESNGSAGSESSQEEGLPVTAPKEEFIEAFQELDPIHIQFQAVESKGQPEADYYLKYIEALEEWSGGKMTVEIAYGNSIASPDDVPQAIADGRINMERVYPLYDPSRYPANAAFADSAFLGKHSPVAGSFQTFAAYLEVGLSTPELQPEFANEGMFALLPYGPQTAPGILCESPHDTLADWKGTQIRVSGNAHAEQVKALGMSPVSLAYSEVYPALERGTIDCLVGADWSFRTTGVLPLAPYYTLDDEVGFTKVVAPMVFTKQMWDDMPLVAKQLLWDKLDVLVGEFFEDHIFKTMVAAQKDIVDAGASVNQLDTAAREAFLNANERLLEGIESSAALDGSKLVADLESSLDKWETIVIEELGYSEAIGQDFIDYMEGGEFDVLPFMEKVKEEVLNEHRPS